MKIESYYHDSFIIKLNSKNSDFEKLILSCAADGKVDPSVISRYCSLTKKDWPEAEVFLKDINSILSYCEITKKRLESAEETIAKSGIKNICFYLDMFSSDADILKIRSNIQSHFINYCNSSPTTNPFLPMNPSSPSSEAFNYCKEVVKGRCADLEPIIMKCPVSIFNYSKYILKKRWEEAESVLISGEPESAYGWVAVNYYSSIYCERHNLVRWPDFEPFIMKFPKYAYWYAEEVLKDRWEEAESYILQSPLYAYKYAKNVIKGRWPEAEMSISDDVNCIYDYAKDIIKGKLPEEMHNKAIAMSLANPSNKNLKKYFSYKKYRKKVTC